MATIAGAVAAAALGFTLARATAPNDGALTVVAPTPGPRHVVAGVPTGFARSPNGAVAALLNYATTLGDPRVLLQPTRRDRVLSIVATRSYAATFQGPSAAALEAARRGPLGRDLVSGAQSAYLASPIAYRVVSYTRDRAVIQGWGVAVVASAAGVKPQATWGTTLTTARWERGDWRIDAVRSDDGPVPGLAPGQAPSAASDFLTRLGGFRGVRHAP